MIFTNFADLAKSYKTTNDIVNQDTIFEQVKKVCGIKGAVVHAWLNKQEQHKAYGPKGHILNSPTRIASELGWDVSIVETCLINLAKNNLISKITADGRVAA